MAEDCDGCHVVVLGNEQRLREVCLCFINKLYKILYYIIIIIIQLMSLLNIHV